MTSARLLLVSLIFSSSGLAAADARAGQEYVRSKLDLVSPLDPLGLFEALSPSNTQDFRVASSAFRYRFDPRDPSRWEIIWGSSASAALFSLAVINAFIPRWLPKKMSHAFAGQGNPGGSDQPPHSPGELP